jgi:chromate reductase, NAD(P)H dehydrogenase (quinone)
VALRPAPIRIVTVCGSLQRHSANRAVLDVAGAVAAAAGAHVDDFDQLASIPPFDPDRDPGAIAAVAAWHALVSGADAVLVAAPEYAGALAGAVKNAFDWLVGLGSLYRKPVAVMSAGTSGGLHARRMMAQTATWQGGYVVAELGVAAPRTKSDAEGRLTDAATLASIEALVATLLEAPTLSGREVVARATAVVGELGIDVAHVAPAA